MTWLREGIRGWIDAAGLVLVCILILAGCATTNEQQVSLTLRAGMETAYQYDTAREALPAYQRMAADRERRGEIP